MQNVILILMATIPVIILLKYVFDKDKIEKEPILLLLRLFIAGLFSFIITMLLSSSLNKILNINNNFYQSFIKVALLEEFIKWFFICRITWNHKEFDYKFDAIVYCIFVSLGFAFLENVGYAFSYGLTTCLLRAVTSVPGHAFFAIYMGYYLGIAKMNYTKGNRKKGFENIIYSIMIPTLLHGIYDYCLLSGHDGIYVLFIIFIIVLYVLGIKTVNLSSKLDMAFESKENYHY